jgi:hypothetical protein
MMGVGEVSKVGEEHAEMGFSVSEWSAEEHALFPLPTPGSALDVGKIVVSYCFHREDFRC